MIIDQRYPLLWPTGTPRTPPEDRRRLVYDDDSRRTSPTIPEAAVAVGKVLAVLAVGCENWFFTSNVDVWAGLADTEPEDVGVVVHIITGTHRAEVACDKYDRVADNLYTIAWDLGHYYAGPFDRRTGAPRLH